VSDSVAEPDGPTDRELWDRAAAGEADCFGTIFDRHAGRVHAYLRTRVGPDGDAQDLVSVVFLEGWRARRRVRLHEESALPWLLGVAHRVALRRHRSVSRHRAALARLPAAADVRDPADDVAGRLDDLRRLDAVHRAFSRLRAGDQEVLALCAWGGLDYAAAAVAMGVPVGTVRSRLSRARARLAALTEADDPSLLTTLATQER
jgi:RNA polymerase sigma factor (sigma-70 family)